jgi:hypothetical protein
MYAVTFKRFDDDTIYTFGTYDTLKLAERVLIALSRRNDVASAGITKVRQ